MCLVSTLSQSRERLAEREACRAPDLRLEALVSHLQGQRVPLTPLRKFLSLPSLQGAFITNGR